MERPKIVCLCGSTRFAEEFHKQNLRLTLQGFIVLSIGCDMKTDAEVFEGYTPEQLAKVKIDLDVLHLAKIDMADRILVLDVDGYIGESTRREIAYAEMRRKEIVYLTKMLWDERRAAKILAAQERELNRQAEGGDVI